MPAFETRDLAIYASVVGTLNGAWALYNGVVRDRPRIVVRAVRGEAVPTGGGARQPLLMVTVSNRGRRAVSIDGIARLERIVAGTSIVTVDLMQQTADKPRLAESQSRTFVHGQLGGYTHGDLAESRWYITDGAGRIHPLRERFRQRLYSIVFWPIRRAIRWRDARRSARERDDGDDLIEV
jgi:hypothetical protein